MLRLLPFPLALLLAAFSLHAGGGAGEGEPIGSTDRPFSVDLALRTDTATLVALVGESPNSTTTAFSLRERVDAPGETWTTVHTFLATVPSADADLETLYGTAWIAYVRSATTIGIRAFAPDGGVTETFPFLELSAGTEVEEVELEAVGGLLRVMVGLSDGTFRYLRGTPDDPPRLVDLEGLLDRVPAFGRGLSLSSRPHGLVPITHAAYSWITPGGEVATASIWRDLFHGTLKTTESSAEPRPSVPGTVERTSVAMRDSTFVEAHDAPPAVEVRVRRSGTWSDLETATWTSGASAGIAEPASDEFLVLQRHAPSIGIDRMLLTSLSIEGHPRVRARIADGTFASWNRLELLPLDDHLAAVAWIEGPPGAFDTEARFELVDLGESYVFLDGFESGDASAWAPEPGMR